MFSTTIMVRSLSLTQQNTILSLLDSGNSGEAIAKQVGVSPSAVSKPCSKKCSTLPRWWLKTKKCVNLFKLRHIGYMRIFVCINKQ